MKWVVVGALLGALVAGCGSHGERGVTRLTVDWGGSEGHPGCVYDARHTSVEATLTITGHAARTTKVTVTVTAYSDENTSRPVGSGARSVNVDGTVDTSIVVTFPVNRKPYVDIDGVTACSREVQY